MMRLGPVVFLVLLAGAGADLGKVSGEQAVQNVGHQVVQVLTADQFFDQYCKGQNPNSLIGLFCSSLTTSTSTTSTTTISATSVATNSPTTAPTTSAAVAPVNNNAPWCHLQNGTTLPLGFTFMNAECTLCQCSQSRAVLCASLQCMPTTCIDSSTPVVRAGQCCSQCAYEKPANTCAVGGVNFPNGVLLRRTSDSIQCWCQYGSIECRKASNSLFSGLDLWGAGSAVYVIVIIICVVLILGTILCCSVTLCFYYYYQRQQRAAQQSYNEYYNNAGWQPMGEDGQVADSTAEEKQAEAEQSEPKGEYPTGNSAEYIPPPYALYNGTYPNEKAAQ